MNLIFSMRLRPLDVIGNFVDFTENNLAALLGNKRSFRVQSNLSPTLVLRAEVRGWLISYISQKKKEDGRKLEPRTDSHSS